MAQPRSSVSSNPLTMPQSITSAKLYRRVESKMRRKTVHRRIIRGSLLAINIVILAIIMFFVLHNPTTADSIKSAALADDSSAASTTINPLDQLASANVALTAARMNSLPEATAIKNQADSESTALTIASTNYNVVSKPQVIITQLKSQANIQTYVVRAGDTVASIAKKFGVTSDSIRWSNGLSGNTVVKGAKLVIPPVNGIVYTVRGGDTAGSLAAKYGASKEQIIAYNDAEISGLRVGEQIIIPNAKVQTVSTYTSYSSSYSSSGFAWGSAAVYGSNGYDYGYCTWYVANRRIAIGRPLPANLGDAWTWDDRARLAGISVNNTPRAGDAIVTRTYSSPGHVAYVDSVDAAGNVYISEMNVAGWNVVSSRVIPASQAGGYNYIH